MSEFLHTWILICQCRSQVQFRHIFKGFICYLWAYIVSVHYIILANLIFSSIFSAFNDAATNQTGRSYIS